MSHHNLDATPQNLFWGFFDATTPAVLTVDSGDTVKLTCMPAGLRADQIPDDNRVRADHKVAMEALSDKRGIGSHMMTGPVFVQGAVPGDVLQVDILTVKPIQDWGFSKIAPLKGALPEEFTDYEHFYSDIDLANNTCTLPWGTELPLEPFFGIMAVAPPPQWGRIGTAEPRAFGGNMDNKELQAGSTLYLPVFNEGALFSAGDGHGRQGDGEVCITALETALTGEFRLTVRKDITLTAPFAENSEYLISMGFHEDLDQAMKRALRDMIVQVTNRTSLTRNQAYVLLSLAGDLRITQVVDGEKGVHMMLRKEWLATRV